MTLHLLLELAARLLLILPLLIGAAWCAHDLLPPRRRPARAPVPARRRRPRVGQPWAGHARRLLPMAIGIGIERAGRRSQFQQPVP
jgi:hypothetical protein